MPRTSVTLGEYVELMDIEEKHRMFEAMAAGWFPDSDPPYVGSKEFREEIERDKKRVAEILEEPHA